MMQKGLGSSRNPRRIQHRIRDDPSRTVRRFERLTRVELGVAPGMGWTVLEWVRKQRWGTMKGLQRCAAEDVAVLHAPRANRPEEATAQVVQNLKPTLRSAMGGGGWGSAWLLTGRPDPIFRPELAGDEGEVSAIAGCRMAMAELRKRAAKGLTPEAGNVTKDPERG